MAKKAPQRRKQQTRETNWVVIGGLIALGVVVFSGLLWLALRPGENATVQTLAEFCAANPDNCVSRGEADAPVTMVEVSDFGCSHCTNFHNQTAEPLAEQFVEPGTLRWVALPYALSTTTVPAAAAALCADEQDRFFEFTDALFSVDPVETRITAAGYQQAAEAVSLDMDAFQSCMDDGRNLSIVNANREVARSNGVSGTPTFFLNDQTLSGAQPLEVFAQTIESLLAQ
jgi:protein-disulfide isomerase